jgi:hypothetical protein
MYTNIINTLTDNTYNLFGSACLFSCFFSSLDTTYSNNYNVTHYIPLGVTLILTTNFFWYSSHTKAFRGRITDIVYDVVDLWHRSMVFVTDIAIFLLICQPMSRNVNSQMHVPIEFAYIPIILCMCFIIDRSIYTPPPRVDDKKPVISYGRITTTILSMICFFVICQYDQHGIDLTNHMNESVRIFSFTGAVILYAIPMKPTAPHKHTGTDFIALALSKIAILTTGIFLFSNKASPLVNSSYKLHDYYSLRVLSQYNLELEELSETRIYHQNALLVNTPIITIVLNMLLKFTYIMLIGNGFSGLKSSIQARLKYLHPNNVPATTMHELVLCYFMACILLGILVVSRHFQSLHDIVPDTHSDGFLWVILSSIIIPLVFVLGHLLSLLIQRYVQNNLKP